MNVKQYEVTPELLSSYTGRLETHVRSLNCEVYRDMLCNAFYCGDLVEKLSQRGYLNLNYPGALFRHTILMLKISAAVIEEAQSYEVEFDPDLVICGCILGSFGSGYVWQLFSHCEKTIGIKLDRTKRDKLVDLFLKTESFESNIIKSISDIVKSIQQ